MVKRRKFLPSNPLPSKVEKVKKPVVPGELVKPVNWSFSFKFFRQIPYFGFSHTDSGWFISLLERLQDLSSVNKDQLDTNPVYRDNYRYHQINWGHRNVPISRSDLNWINREYLNNETEFPFYQFHISQALGRIVGFWDSSSLVFHIVLLDPLHNIQPSQINNYKVDDCYPVNCQYTALLGHIDNMKRRTCNNDQCGYKPVVNAITPHIYPERIVIAHLEEDTFNEYEEALRTRSIGELIQLGIVNTLG